MGLFIIRGSGFHDSRKGKPSLLITLMFVLRYGGLSEKHAVLAHSTYMLFNGPDDAQTTKRDICLLFQESVGAPGHPDGVGTSVAPSSFVPHSRGG